ncbi:MAG: 16S rRNA (uracil(1498)-N(3))-methyltransferase [Deltaproteobacteria bacterium]|jgi:16S rRNA (uracil1498-N3)-methyltransferase|nr:16S rRNA (uracil(1498)-N(3))-methyltransferase [Deltaproteobacteria bacterium]
MPQFFTDADLKLGTTIELTGQDAHHIHNVLRLKPGDWILISDGEGRSFKSNIIESMKKSVTISLDKQIKRLPFTPPPTLAISPISRERFEWVVEKSVELGCKRIIPMITNRTVPHRAKIVSDQKKIRRLNEIALSAAKQSGLPFRPTICEPLIFTEVMKGVSEYDSSILFYEGEEKADIRSFWKTRSNMSNDLIIVGPEGGFTNDEITLAQNAGTTLLSLGQQILRVETAAIAAISIWQYEIGNMDLPACDG